MVFPCAVSCSTNEFPSYVQRFMNERALFAGDVIFPHLKTRARPETGSRPTAFCQIFDGSLPFSGSVYSAWHSFRILSLILRVWESATFAAALCLTFPDIISECHVGRTASVRNEICNQLPMVNILAKDTLFSIVTHVKFYTCFRLPHNFVI